MLPHKLRTLIQLFARLPGVGEKTAQRYVLELVSGDDQLAADLGEHLVALTDTIRTCEECGNIAEVAEDGLARCRVCQDTERSDEMLCVVARVQDLLAIERSGAMRGRYFVLGKLLSPLDGVGPEQLPLQQLLEQIASRSVTEVVIATPPSVDGEATALFIARELQGKGLKLSRIASGVPHGGDLEYADQITLGRAIAGRQGLDGS